MSDEPNVNEQENDENVEPLILEMREELREIGRRVRTLRTIHEMTQTELAVLTFGEESGGRISNVETGRSLPVQVLLKLAEVFEVPAWQLLHPGFKIKTVVEIDTGE